MKFASTFKIYITYIVTLVKLVKLVKLILSLDFSCYAHG
jgi:hypothetical protein